MSENPKYLKNKLSATKSPARTPIRIRKNIAAVTENTSRKDTVKNNKREEYRKYSASGSTKNKTNRNKIIEATDPITYIHLFLVILFCPLTLQV